MSDETTRTLTQFGFQFGHLEVTRLYAEGNGAAVRIRNLVSGDYVDVQCTPKGRKTYVSSGKYTADRETVK